MTAATIVPARHQSGMRNAAVAVLLELALSGCRRAPSSAPEATGIAPECTLVRDGAGPIGRVPVRVETVVAGLEVPWGLAFLPGGEALVTERPGRVRVLRGGRLSAPVAEIAIGAGGEGGLLGIAAHPRFAENRFFYVYLTTEEGGARSNRVERWRLEPDGARAVRDRVILAGIPGAKYHDGGRIRFGPDGMLHVGTGDGGEPDRSQSMESLAGKLLRVDPDGGVPADNPFPGSPVLLLGIRNTQGFDWGPNGALLVTDHGPSGDTGRRDHDEVNVARRGDNLGWPTLYGCEARAPMITPSLTWEEAAPPGGAAVYTGTAIPEWRGSLIVGVLGAKHLHRVVLDPGSRRVTAHEVYFPGDPPEGHGRLRDVVMGPDGALYVTTSNCDGRGECPDDKDRILRVTR